MVGRYAVHERGVITYLTGHGPKQVRHLLLMFDINFEVSDHH